MQISQSIRWILDPQTRWGIFRNRPYRAYVQIADPEQVYNVAGRPGVVYNYLEDACEPVSPGGYVITGAVGEMWPIGPESIEKYDISPADVTAEPQPAMTRAMPALWAGVMIPAETEFTVTAQYGDQETVLTGNRPGIPHGRGDWVLVRTVTENGIVRPDLTGSGRVINGKSFGVIYRPVAMHIFG